MAVARRGSTRPKMSLGRWSELLWLVLLSFVASSCSSSDSSATVDHLLDVRAAATRLQELYVKSLDSSWRIDGRFVRTIHGRDDRLASPMTVINRPPDSLIVGLGGVSGTYKGRNVQCNVPEPAGEPAERSVDPVCSDAVPAPDFSLRRVSDEQTFADLIDPLTGMYEVSTSEPRVIASEATECFILALRAPQTNPPMGDAARMCFARDGARLYDFWNRAQGSDLREATSVRRDVTDADFAPWVESAEATAASSTSPPASSSTTATTTSSAGPPGEVDSTSPPPPSSNPVGSSSDVGHTVQRGESLWSIAVARSTVTDQRSITRYWANLVRLNRTRLRSGDPDVLYVGEVVRLPE